MREKIEMVHGHLPCVVEAEDVLLFGRLGADLQLVDMLGQLAGQSSTVGEALLVDIIQLAPDVSDRLQILQAEHAQHGHRLG